MRAFVAGAAGAALALATGAQAKSKFISTIDEWIDPATKPAPGNNRPWSYYPNSWGTLPGNTCGFGNGTNEPCGPLNWQLGPWLFGGESCDQNLKQQTPIDFDIAEADYMRMGKTQGELIFSGYPCQADVEPKGGTWEVDFLHCYAESAVMVNGEKWIFWQMHVHGPSEHTVNGGYYPLEIHLVHLPPGTSPVDSRRLPSKALVVGIFVTVGKVNNVWKVFTQHRPGELGHIYREVNPYDLLPKSSKAYWHYTGSLTTPFGLEIEEGPPLPTPIIGCNLPEGIRWYVMKKPITMSAAQLAWTTEYINRLPLPFLGMNNRPVQKILPTTQISSYGKGLN